MTLGKQKVAVVTASDSGIGRSCAVMLAEAGYTVGITWRSDEEGAQETARLVESKGQLARCGSSICPIRRLAGSSWRS